MSDAHRSDSIILFSDASGRTYHRPTSARKGSTMHADREHVISVVLNHEEWKAFVKLQPQPVTWLRDRIQETIAAARPPAPGSSAPADTGA
jgi:hypothetical protein